MLFQMHEVDSSEQHGFVAQTEFGEDCPPNALNDWARDVMSRHVLPEGSHWLICNENAPEFFLMAT